MHHKPTEYSQKISLGENGFILGEKVEGFLIDVLFGFGFFWQGVGG